MNVPLVAVLMPVYNGEKYLAEAIESILAQTFTDFDFLIVDDGSTDGTAEILVDYAHKDSRIQIIQNEKNIGIAESLNRGIELARGEYIVRMDADDVSLPERLVTQVAYLEKHLEVSVCGSFLSLYETGERWEVPVKNEEIRAQFFFNSCLYHPTVIMRRVSFVEYGKRYNPQALHAEDYDLWARLSFHTGIAFANIPEVLLRYRVYPDSFQRASYKASQRKMADTIRKMLLARLEIFPTDEEFACHEIFYAHGTPEDSNALYRSSRWLTKIYLQNQKLRICDGDALKKHLSVLWRDFCRRSTQNVSLVPLIYLLSPFVEKNMQNIREVYSLWKQGRERK